MIAAAKDAHYLHKRLGLTALVRPAVVRPRALAWAEGDRLGALAEDGTLHVAHPILGTRKLLGPDAPASGLAADGRRLLRVTEDGQWVVVEVCGTVVAHGEHPFQGAVAPLLVGERALIAGSIDGERHMLVFDGTRVTMRVQLPARAIPVLYDDGKVQLIQATKEGIERIELGRGHRFSRGRPLPHQLRVYGSFVVGTTSREVRVWKLRSGELVHTVKAPSTLSSAAVTTDGEWLAMGDEEGSVAFHGIGSAAPPERITACSGAVADLAFSDDNPWLASAADGLVLWTWGSVIDRG